MTEKQFLKKLKDLGAKESGKHSIFNYDRLYQIKYYIGDEKRFLNVQAYDHDDIGSTYEVHEQKENDGYTTNTLYFGFSTYQKMIEVITAMIYPE